MRKGSKRQNRERHGLVRSILKLAQYSFDDQAKSVQQSKNLSGDLIWRANSFLVSRKKHLISKSQSSLITFFLSLTDVVAHPWFDLK
jgi:hypothetical protein